MREYDRIVAESIESLEVWLDDACDSHFKRRLSPERVAEISMVCEMARKALEKEHK